MNHLAGKKFTSTHTTVTDATKPLVAFLSKQESVKKISLGIITRISGKSSRMRVKIADEPACLVLKVHGNSSVQEVRIYTDEKLLVQKLIEDFVS